MDDYPTQFTIRAAVPQLIRIADRTGLVVQNDAPLLILLSLPLVDDISAYRCTELPFGAAWTVERFSTSTLGWKPATREEAIAAAGLFRFSFRHERRVFYRTRGVATELGAQTGKYIVLKRRRRRVFEYDRSSHTVAVRPSCRPPFLIERALICPSRRRSFANRLRGAHPPRGRRSGTGGTTGPCRGRSGAGRLAFHSARTRTP